MPSRETTKLAEPPAAAKALIEGVVLPPGLRPGEVKAEDTGSQR